MNKFLNRIMVLVFGKSSKDGFYDSSKKGERKPYRFSSVFPNEESLENFLEQSDDKNPGTLQSNPNDAAG